MSDPVIGNSLPLLDPDAAAAAVAAHLVDANLWLAAVVESSDDAIISKTLGGIITSWNKGAERIFGYAAAEIVGRPMCTLIPPERLGEEADILARLTRGERIDHFETLRLARDGRPVEVSVTISPVRDASGRIVGASKIARDISVQKRTERDLRATRDAAEAANRAKDHFLSILSHELRTPLTPALAAVSLIESSPDMAPPEVARLIEMVRRNIETEARLVDDLLDVTRISQGKVELHAEAIDAHAAVRGVVEMLRAEVDAKGLAVTLSLGARQRHVWADAGRFQQVLLNLLSNAVKFTPAEGRVLVRTTDAAERADGQGRPGLQLDVVDSGIGIDPETLPRLFQPFEQGERTVTRTFGGLGLGLSIVRSLVELHGGRVTAASDGADQGSTFTLWMATVPAVQRAAAQPIAPLAPAEAAPRCRVLLVEDHDDTRLVLARLLGSFGFLVTPVATVRRAKELVDEHAFDLLVSDIGLPDGSGLDVMRHARQHGVPRGIALSGFGQDDDQRRSLDAGFERHLTKPINFTTFRDVILQSAG